MAIPRTEQIANVDSASGRAGHIRDVVEVIDAALEKVLAAGRESQGRDGREQERASEPKKESRIHGDRSLPTTRLLSSSGFHTLLYLPS